MDKDETPPSPRRDAPFKATTLTKNTRRPLPLKPSALPRSKTTSVLPNKDLTSATQGQARSTMTPLTPTRMASSPSSYPAITAELEGCKKGHSLLDVFKKDRSSSHENSKMPRSPLPSDALMSPKAWKVLGLPAPPREGEEEYHPAQGVPKSIYLTQDMVQARDDRIAAKLAKEDTQGPDANTFTEQACTKTKRFKKAGQILGLSRPKSSGKDKNSAAAFDTTDEEVSIQ
jgi:hypothetical protein